MIAGMIIPYGNQDETLKKLENNFIVKKNELVFFLEIYLKKKSKSEI